MAGFNVRTLGEVARFFGVSTQTVKGWRSDGMPGKSPHWPLDKIARWKIQRALDSAQVSSPQAKNQIDSLKAARLAIQVQREKARHEREMGQLIDVDLVGDLLERMIAEHNSQFEQFRDKVLDLVPRNVDGKDRTRIQQRIDKLVDELRNMMADMAEEWERGNLDDGEEEEEEAA